MNAWIRGNWALFTSLLEVATGGLLVLAIVFLVLWLRASRARRHQHLDRVDAELDVIDLELSLAEQTNRLRIIRELHDVAVHDVSVIISQADGARLAGATDPTAAVRAVTAIADSAKSLLADLRRVMTVVHEGEADAAAHPTLRSVRELFGVMREAGLALRVEETGRRFPLKAGAEVTIYRILQEALTNALKHGGPGTEAVVHIGWTDEGFQLRVEDDGMRRSGDAAAEGKARKLEIDDDLRALTGTVTGAGISEMRERAELFGGVFDVNVLPGVGISVTASFPNLRYHNGIHGVNLGA
ncbi:histidine kinase [Galbitalea sp. SE-J8]|uniref:sensor histidine kinase n=1 Tax=Galbitalea sp. SE-J8 TaxID=3054952 RepID=UPI00259C9BF1|nr:ATP-binding protein [Galbitalea sp. SE-J8]MDM4761868.1 histidine kinase [Galbitalea sp. SE-J8]